MGHPLVPVEHAKDLYGRPGFESWRKVAAALTRPNGMAFTRDGVIQAVRRARKEKAE